MLARILISLLTLSFIFSGCQDPQSRDRAPVMTAYRDALIGQLDKLESSLPEITQSTDIAAERLLAGGNLYSAGETSFVSESYTRAGGMMMVMKYTDKVELSANDVLLVGARTNDDQSAQAACKRGKESGAYVVLFSPAFDHQSAPLARACDAHVVNFAVGDYFAVTVGAQKRAGPTSSLYNITTLWAYTAELVGSLTRRGKMPVMWRSSALPGASARNNRYWTAVDHSKKRFHDDMTVPPQAEGWLGRLYIDTIRREVAGLRGPVMKQLAEAAALMAESVRRGGTVHVQTISHFTAYEVTGPDCPPWIKADYDILFKGSMEPEQLVVDMKHGDIFFQLGYYCVAATNFKVDTGYVEAVREARCKSILALCHAPFAPLDGPQPDILIDAQWEYGDAIVLVPGYDAKILPPSSVLQTAVLWSVIGTTQSLLSDN